MWDRIRRFATREEYSTLTVVVTWVVVAALVLGTNLATGGVVGLDGDVVQLDGDTIEVQTRSSSVQAFADLGTYGPGAPRIGGRPIQEDAVATEQTIRLRATGGEKRSFYLLAGGQMLAIVGGAMCLERLMRRAARRRPFADANVLWLRLLAVSFAVGAIALPVLMHRWEGQVIARGVDLPAGAPSVEPLTHGPGLLEVVVVGVLLILAEVWRRGIVLRREVEATI